MIRAGARRGGNRASPYLRTKVFSIFSEPARKMFARSRWLFKGIDNGDIKELFLGSSLPLTSKNDFWHRVRGSQKSFF